MKTTRTFLTLMIGLLYAFALTACGTEALPPEPIATNLPVASPTEASILAPTQMVNETPTETVDANATTVSFSKDVYPILESRCLNCHGGDNTREGLSVKSYADLMAGSDNGFVVLPGDAANSLLVELVATQEMPKRGAKLTPPQVQLLTDWVNQGALEN